MCFLDRQRFFGSSVSMIIGFFFLFDYLEKNADFPEKLCFVLFNYENIIKISQNLYILKFLIPYITLVY